jgi:hypothetical protein
MFKLRYEFSPASAHLNRDPVSFNAHVRPHASNDSVSAKVENCTVRNQHTEKVCGWLTLKQEADACSTAIDIINVFY